MEPIGFTNEFPSNFHKQSAEFVCKFPSNFLNFGSGSPKSKGIPKDKYTYRNGEVEMEVKLEVKMEVEMEVKISAPILRPNYAGAQLFRYPF